MNYGDDYFNLFRYDRRSDTIELASQSQAGVGGNGVSCQIGPAWISSDGQWVAFESWATNLMGTPPSGVRQAYLAWLGARFDCDGNGLPYDCEPAGFDCDADDIPDACECGCPGDANGDGRTDGLDVRQFIECIVTSCSPAGCACADLDANGVMDESDVPLFANALTAGAAGCP
jgi:hypothetical protein